MVYAPLFQGVIHTSGGQISPSVHCSQISQLCALKLLQVCILDDTFIVGPVLKLWHFLPFVPDMLKV